MTVIPFRSRRGAVGVGTEAAPAPSAVVSGWFGSPTGRRGRFTGVYRLEGHVQREHTIEVVGVFAGLLTDADGTRVGLGARRHRGVARRVSPSSSLRLDQVVVDLLGFPVTMEPVSLSLDGPAASDLPAAGPATGAGR